MNPQQWWLDKNPWYLELPEYHEGMVVKCPIRNRDGTPIDEDDIRGCGSTSVGFAGDVYDCYECGIDFSDHAADPPHRRKEVDDDENDDPDDDDDSAPAITLPVCRPARLLIKPDGTLQFIYSDSLQAIAKAVGQPETRRASHVEPDGDGWSADMSPSGGPKLTGFATRKAALDAEVEWIEQNVLT